jgi:hypothetical protein
MNNELATYNIVPSQEKKKGGDKDDDKKKSKKKDKGEVIILPASLNI